MGIVIALSLYIYIYRRVVRYRLAVEMRQGVHQKSVRLFFSGGRAGNCGMGPATAFHWLVLVFESVLKKSPVVGGSIHGAFAYSTKYH